MDLIKGIAREIVDMIENRSNELGQGRTLGLFGFMDDEGYITGYSEIVDGGLSGLPFRKLLSKVIDNTDGPLLNMINQLPDKAVLISTSPGKTGIIINTGGINIFNIPIVRIGIKRNRVVGAGILYPEEKLFQLASRSEKMQLKNLAANNMEEEREALRELARLRLEYLDISGEIAIVDKTVSSYRKGKNKSIVNVNDKKCSDNNRINSDNNDITSSDKINSENNDKTSCNTDNIKSYNLSKQESTSSKEGKYKVLGLDASFAEKLVSKSIEVEQGREVAAIGIVNREGYIEEAGDIVVGGMGYVPSRMLASSYKDISGISLRESYTEIIPDNAVIVHTHPGGTGVMHMGDAMAGPGTWGNPIVAIGHDKDGKIKGATIIEYCEEMGELIDEYEDVDQKFFQAETPLEESEIRKRRYQIAQEFTDLSKELEII